MQSYYIELQDLTINNFLEFAKYMIEFRTVEVDLDGIKFNTFKQLDNQEEFPSIIFTIRKPGTIANYTYHPLAPLPIPRLHAMDYIDGQYVEPVFNLESRLETYYLNGIQDGNLQYLYEFSKILMLAVSSSMDISTELVDGVRKFMVTNTNFSNSKFYIPHK